MQALGIRSKKSKLIYLLYLVQVDDSLIVPRSVVINALIEKLEARWRRIFLLDTVNGIGDIDIVVSAVCHLNNGVGVAGCSKLGHNIDSVYLQLYIVVFRPDEADIFEEAGKIKTDSLVGRDQLPKIEILKQYGTVIVITKILYCEVLNTPHQALNVDTLTKLCPYPCMVVCGNIGHTRISYWRRRCLFMNVKFKRALRS